MNIVEWFKEDSLGSVIKGFPYKPIFCRYCEQPCDIVSAIHLQEEPEHFKALYLCFNKDCGVYDEDAKVQYTKVYYSSDKAHHDLELHRIYYERNRKV